MKKLLLTALFAGLSVSTVLPVDGKTKDMSYDPSDRFFYGWAVGVGMYLDNSELGLNATSSVFRRAAVRSTLVLSLIGAGYVTHMVTDPYTEMAVQKVKRFMQDRR